MDVYATHLPTLTSMLAKTTGPVLELGCGNYSTPVLHEMCRIMKRRLVTVEEKQLWMDQFLFLKSDLHEFYFVKNWDELYIKNFPFWSVVLVDHAPGERRVVDIEKLKNLSDYIVVHDTEEAGYKYEPILSLFKYRYNCELFRPWTTVVSNFHDLGFLR